MCQLVLKTLKKLKLSTKIKTVCLCVKDIEDSELLEMMDMCDQESGLNPHTQQDTLVPSTVQVIKRGK